MKAGEWSEAHSALMETAAAETASGEADLEATWHQVARRIDTTPRSHRHKRAIAIVAASAALAGAATATAAATDLFSSHTGEYPSDSEIKKAGPGELLDPEGHDFPQVTLEETADIPFPSEEARAISAQTHVEEQSAEESEGDRISTGALRGFVANDAICSWSNAWARATAGSDDAAAMTAASTLMTADDWPAVRALDTELSTRTTEVHFTDGTKRTAEDPTRFYYLTLVQKAVKAGDVDELGSALHGNVVCIPGLMPDLPQAIPTRWP